SYPEAIRYLAKKYNIEIEETHQTDEEKTKRDARESMLLLSDFALDYFKKNLWESSAGKAIGKTYFQERGFTDETIQAFDLGYALETKDAFTSTALEKGYKLEFLKKTGLTIVNEDRKIDRFRGRVLFPIKSMAGRTVGFGGRILGDNKKTAKYLNSPESEIYHKSKVLYGLYESKQAIAREDCCYLVEGYTDVIQMHQRGIKNVVSSSGTALTQEQIRLIQRLTQNIVVLFDGDAAGLRAALRGIDMILSQGMNVKVCSFPEGEDPDSFAKSHSLEEVQAFFNDNAKDFIQFKASLLMQEAQDDPVKKAATIKDMVESIAKIPDAIQREVYVQSCAAIMEISEEVLFSALAQKRAKEVNTKNKRKPNLPQMQVVQPATPAVNVDELYELEKQIITLLMLYGDREETFQEAVLQFSEESSEIEEEITEVKSRVYEKIFLDLQQDEIELANEDFRALFFLLLEQFQTQGTLSIDKLMPTLTPELSSLVSTILMNEEKYNLHQWEKKNIFVKTRDQQIGLMVTETILSLRKHLVNRKIESLQAEMENPQEEHKALLEDVMSYYQLRRLVSNKLNRVL
ncbi:MAG: DNA primase, partial [Flavobacteriaceae bacterium]